MIDVWILDQQFRSLKLIEAYESLLWTERFDRCGDFELYLPMNSELLSYIKQNNYVWIKESETLMIIEEIEIKTDVDLGNRLTISGRSIESILDRRIIWQQTTINGDLQEGINKLLRENAIVPQFPDRAIPQLLYERNDDAEISALKLRAQYTGDNLYDVICNICELFELGWRLKYRDSDQKFVFSLYKGTDRSYNQELNSYVIFSPKFENLIGTNYLESNKTLKNVTLVAGEDTGTSRKTSIVGSGKFLDRREIFTDARDIQSKDDEGNEIPLETYWELLNQRGSEKLAENKETHILDGEVDSAISFKYEVDYFKGDIVQIVNEFGMEFTCRITEVIRSVDDTGYHIYPSFEIIQNE